MYIPRNVSQGWVRWFFRRIAPARPEDLLDPEQMEELAPQVRAFSRRVGLLLPGALLLVVPALGMALHEFSLAFQSEAMNAVWDTRNPVIWIAVAVPFSLWVFRAPFRWYEQRYWADTVSLHRRYETIRLGYDDRRAGMYSSALLLFMAVTASCAAWHDGEVVDDRGIRHRAGFFSHERREYEDVVSVTLYEGLIAPIGLRPGVFNLEVEFHSGDPFRMLVDKGKRTREKLEEIARFISKQSGQPVIRAAIRP